MVGAGGQALLVMRDVIKEYAQGDVVQRVLDGLSVEIAAGRFTAVMGPSGSGKSTMLHLLGGLDTPDAGTVEVDGISLDSLADDDRTRLRRQRIGIVYQFFNLVPVLTVRENVALPLVIAGARPSTYDQQLDDLLELVGLGDHATKQPSQLSGGQQQRAAIARALLIEPTVLLADEPTGNLDLAAGSEVLELFVTAQRETGQTVVMVTHDPRCAAHADDVLLLRDGRIGGALDVTDVSAGAARTHRADPERSRSVLRWLEDLDAAGAASDRVGPVTRSTES